MMFWSNNGWSGWQMAAMWVAMVAFWALVIWGVYALVVHTRGSGRAPAPPRDDARQVLDRRLARGEIDADQYRHLLDVMASGA